MIKFDFSKITIPQNSSLILALKQMDQQSSKLLIIVDKEQTYINLLSIGDIQRAIIKGHALTDELNLIAIDKKIVANINDDIQFIKELMLNIRAEFMPVLTDDGKLSNVILWDDISIKNKPVKKIKNDIPVVVMAGGKGTRLKPISNVIPKPLIPIGNNTILEEILNRFETAGSNKFYLSVNYKKEMIEYYLNSIGRKEEIEYFSETQPLGTAGSLSLLKGKIDSTFYVTNCDILIEQDLNEIYEYHKNNKNEITLVAALKQYSIPYGTLTSGKDGLLIDMKEKPDLSFKINAGVYILEPHLLDEIPEDKFFHITDLIHAVKNRQGRVGVFPIPENAWSDIGEWPEYIKTVRKLDDKHSFLGLK